MGKKSSRQKKVRQAQAKKSSFAAKRNLEDDASSNPKAKGFKIFRRKSQTEVALQTGKNAESQHSVQDAQIQSKEARNLELVPVPDWIKIDSRVQAEIESHAYSILDAEVGGMLFGTVHEEYLEIAGFVPARNARVEQISLTFTHDVWDDILSEGNVKFPDSQIVGWYHTHPSFGLFLSEYDSFIQRNFFSSPRQVALVIDPVSGHYGWFANGDKPDEIVSLGVAETLAGPAQPNRREEFRASSEYNSSPRNLKTQVAFLATALVSALIGYGLSSLNSPPDLTSQYNGLIQRIGIIQSGGGAYFYVVQQGDSLESIAKTYYKSKDGLEVLKANNPQFVVEGLNVGDQVVIYAPETLGLIFDYVAPLFPEETPTPSPQDSNPSPSEKPSNTPTGPDSVLKP